jgi:hypothetical protein
MNIMNEQKIDTYIIVNCYNFLVEVYMRILPNPSERDSAGHIVETESTSFLLNLNSNAESKPYYLYPST